MAPIADLEWSYRQLSDAKAPQPALDNLIKAINLMFADGDRRPGEEVITLLRNARQAACAPGNWRPRVPDKGDDDTQRAIDKITLVIDQLRAPAAGRTCEHLGCSGPCKFIKVEAPAQAATTPPIASSPSTKAPRWGGWQRKALIGGMVIATIAAIYLIAPRITRIIHEATK